MTTTEAQALQAQQCWRMYGWSCSAPSTVSEGTSSNNMKAYRSKKYA